MTDALVGVSHECDYPEEVRLLPRLTASAVDAEASSAAIDAAVRELVSTSRPVFALDAEMLRSLAPTVIITQAVCDVCAASEGQCVSLASVVSPTPQVVAMTGTTLEGIWRDIRMIGAALGRTAEADPLLDALDARILRVHERLKAAKAPRPRVAVIEWLEPLFKAGHWTPEVVRRAGGVDVLAEPGEHSAVVTVDAIRTARPDLLIFAPCGFGLARAHREASALLARPEWEWARGVECWALDGNALTSRPGPRLVDAIEVIAGITAPAVFGSPNQRLGRRIDT